MLLSNLKKGEKAVVIDFVRHGYFLSRVLSKGIRINTIVEIFRNSIAFPMLIFASDTLIAIDKKEAKKIIVKKIEV